MFFIVQVIIAAVQVAFIVLLWGTPLVAIPIGGLFLALAFAVKALVDGV